MFEGEEVETEPSRSSCPAYEELLEVIECTTARLDLPRLDQDGGTARTSR